MPLKKLSPGKLPHKKIVPQGITPPPLQDKHTHINIDTNTHRDNKLTHIDMKLHSDLRFKRSKEATQKK